MTVKDLIKSLKDFDPDVQVTAVHNNDNPVTDYTEIIDAYEIRGATREGIDGVVLVMN